MNRKKKENIFLWRFPFITKKKKTNKQTFFLEEQTFIIYRYFFFYFFGEERECAYFKLKYLLPYL